MVLATDFVLLSAVGTGDSSGAFLQWGGVVDGFLVSMSRFGGAQG